MVGDCDDETNGQYVPPEAAFLSGKVGHELFGEPLRNFSLSRKIAAQSMGCLAPAIGSGIDQMRTSGLYPGCVNDTIIVCWLCLQRDGSDQMSAEEYRAGAFTPERAIRQPNLALEKAYAWAESVGIVNQLSAEFLAAYQVFMQIVFAIEASAFQVKVEEVGGPTMEYGSPKAGPGPRTTQPSSPRSPSKAGKRKATAGKS